MISPADTTIVGTVTRQVARLPQHPHDHHHHGEHPARVLLPQHDGCRAAQRPCREQCRRDPHTRRLQCPRHESEQGRSDRSGSERAVLPEDGEQRGTDSGDRQHERRGQALPRVGPLNGAHGVTIRSRLWRRSRDHRTVSEPVHGPVANRSASDVPNVRRADDLTMLTALGKFTVRRRRLVLSFTVLFMVVAGVLGTRAFGVLEGGGFEDPASESERASEALARDFQTSEPDLVLVATAAGGDVDAPAAEAAGAELAERVATVDGVTEVSSYWSLGSPPPLRNANGDAALVLVRIDDDEAPAEEIVADVREAVEGDAIAGLDVAVGGSEAVFADVTETIEGDLGRAEASPSRSRCCSCCARVRRSPRRLAPPVRRRPRRPRHVPVAVRHRLADRRVDLRHQPDHRPRARPRHRLQPVHRLPLPRGAAQRPDRRGGRRAHGRDGRADRSRSARSPSRCRSRRCSCSRSTSCARSPTPASPSCCWRWLASIVALPALLAVVGHRIDALRVFRRRERKREEDGFWYRMATRVMRRPIPVALGVVAVLLLLGAPFLRVQFGTPDDRVLPESAPSRDVSETLRNEFEGDASESFPVVVEGIDGDVDRELSALAADVSALDGVARVDDATVGDGSGWLSVVPCDRDGLRRGRAARPRDPRHRHRRRGARRRSGRPARRHQGIHRRSAAAGPRDHRGRHVRAAVPARRAACSCRSRRSCSTCSA